RGGEGRPRDRQPAARVELEQIGRGVGAGAVLIDQAGELATHVGPVAGLRDGHHQLGVARLGGVGRRAPRRPGGGRERRGRAGQRRGRGRRRRVRRRGARRGPGRRARGGGQPAGGRQGGQA